MQAQLDDMESKINQIAEDVVQLRKLFLFTHEETIGKKIESRKHASSSTTQRN